MKALTLLLHDERFSGWTLQDKLTRHHFSVEYMRHYVSRGAEPVLYTLHQQIDFKQVYRVDGAGTVKIFPVGFRFPPFLRFGNDHNVKDVIREMVSDNPDLVHFHNYYLASFPYVAAFVKNNLRTPLIAQLHGYDNRSFRKWLYLPCLIALRYVDKILYSYEPERAIYAKLGVLDRAEKLPVPGVEPGIFMPGKRSSIRRFLYVGRIPAPDAAYGEKSPYLLVHVLKRLLRLDDDVGLDIVGDGPGMQSVVELVKRLGVSGHVAFHGYVPYGDLPKYYRAAALTFAPIQVYDVDGWFDGSIQESLACGTPVVALKSSRKTPLRGTYGFLLSTDAENAAAELHTLLRRSEDMDDVAIEGSRFVRENCSYERVVSELERVSESVLSK